jgi:hypothetical protein
MSYIERSLSKDEEIYQIFKLHWMVGFLVFINIILSVITAGIWLIPAIVIILSWKTLEQGVTNKRVIRKHGIISIQTNEMRLNAIESIFIDQGIIGRILGYGTVTITGRGQSDVKLKWMADPLRVKREIESIEYGEVRKIPVEKDGTPINYHDNEIVMEGEKNRNLKIIGAAVAISIFLVFVLITIYGDIIRREKNEQLNLAHTSPPIDNPKIEQENLELSRYKAIDLKEEANKQINIVWNGTTKEIRATILPDQKEWLKQREAGCTAKSEEESNDSIAKDTIKFNCMAYMTDQRTEVLKQKITALSQNQDDFSWNGNFIDNPGTLKISGKKYNLTIKIETNTPTMGGETCTGSIEGNGKFIKDSIFMTKLEQGQENPCEVTIHFSGENNNTASVADVSCGAFSGASCSIGGEVRRIN